MTPDDLRPAGEDGYDLDGVYDWASGEPDPVHVSALADVVDMVARIADCCDDGALRRLVEDTPEYAELVDEEVSYQGKDGRKRWNDLGDTIADNWERAIARVESWLSWQGDFSGSDLDAETVWDRVGAEPIEIRLADVTYLTVRGFIAPDTEEDAEAVFLGSDSNVLVFREVADLAQYCRVATEHDLVALEWWGELAEVEDDAVFAPGLDAAYDLRKPSASGRRVAARTRALLQPRTRPVRPRRGERRPRRLARPARRDRDLLPPAGLSATPAPEPGRRHPWIRATLDARRAPRGADRGGASRPGSPSAGSRHAPDSRRQPSATT